MAAPAIVCVRMTASSSDVNWPSLSMSDDGNASLPMSWTSAARYTCWQASSRQRQRARDGDGRRGDAARVRQQPRLVVVQILEHLLQRLERARLRAADLLGQPVAPAGDVQQDGLKAGARRPGLRLLGLDVPLQSPHGFASGCESAGRAPG